MEKFENMAYIQNVWNTIKDLVEDNHSRLTSCVSGITQRGRPKGAQISHPLVYHATM